MAPARDLDRDGIGDLLAVAPLALGPNSQFGAGDAFVFSGADGNLL
ncbi:MAG: hypothetical protein ACE5H3_10485 [Planctomycetota bacterium]